MPSNASLGPYLSEKMNTYDGGYGGGRKKFSMGNIFGDPFPLATLGIGIVRHPAKPALLLSQNTNFEFTVRLDDRVRELHRCRHTGRLP
jgi:hypothetical protein